MKYTLPQKHSFFPPRPTWLRLLQPVLFYAVLLGLIGLFLFYEPLMGLLVD